MPSRSTLRYCAGLKQISDVGAIEKIVDEVLAANPKSVEEFRAGKEKAFNALVGQAMKATRGKANPAAGQRDPAAAARRLSSEQERPVRAAFPCRFVALTWGRPA